MNIVASRGLPYMEWLTRLQQEEPIRSGERKVIVVRFLVPGVARKWIPLKERLHR